MSWRLFALNLWLRSVEKPRMLRARSIPVARARMEWLAAAANPGAARRLAARPVGGLPALRADGPAGAGVLLWLHGGAYCLGSPGTHAALAAELARRAGAGLVLPAYRLAPENAFPAAVEDAVDAWRGLVAEGVPPARIALAGDSAGGGLVFALLHLLIAERAALPACAVAFSPWIDLTLSGASLVELAARDAFLPAERLAEVRDLYLAGADPRDPRASPHLGSFAGAPPVLIQASGDEILADDALAMAERLAADGVAVTLELEPGVPHAWHFFHGRLPEADAALDRAAAFVAGRLKCA
jgi:epsilon-lactone hydrolase